MQSLAKTLAATLIAATFVAPAAAQASLPERAVEALGVYIASQGNAALIQIREEMKRELLERLKPQLPPPETPAPQTPSQPGAQ